MRFSFTLAACVGAAALLTVTGCQAPEPVKGTVVEKEHHAAKLGSEKCGWKNSSGKRKWSCSTSGYKPECYELEIRLKDGSETDVCDKAAYLVLNVEDPYDSTQDYSREDQ